MSLGCKKCVYCDGPDKKDPNRGNGICCECHGTGQLETMGDKRYEGVDDGYSPCPACSPDEIKRGEGICYPCRGTGYWG